MCLGGFWTALDMDACSDMFVELVVIVLLFTWY